MRINSLRSKILVLALINAVLLAAAVVWFVETQLTQDIGSILLSESRGRIITVAKQLARELATSPEDERDKRLARYSADHGVTFYIFHHDERRLGGPAVSLPRPLLENLRKWREMAPMAVRLEARGARGFAPPGLTGGPMNMEGLIRLLDESPFFTQTSEGYWLMLKFALRSGDRPGAQPSALVMMSPNFFQNPFFFNLRPWLKLGGLVLLIALACWFPLIRGTTTSIAALADATSRIAKGAFGTSVKIRRGDELGQLGESMNKMALQLENYMHGQKRFLRDAAHELRSPIARMQAALGNVLETKLDPETVPFLEDMRQEIDVMSSLTGELLTFAREENQTTKLKATRMKLADVVDRVLTTENPGGAADVRAEVDPELIVTAPPESLFRGLSNVVRNAIRYAGHCGPIVIAAERRGESILVTVTDRGPGIPEESLEMVFTPFYRLDVSRDRETGGNGLGMAICRTCIEGCNGTVYCRNLNPGLQVTMTLPLTT
jgi:two-component system sensor histidine kinase CpxA